MSEFNLLRDFVERDSEKSELLKSIRQPVLRRVNASILNDITLAHKVPKEPYQEPDMDLDQCDCCAISDIHPAKYCPKCGMEF